MVVKAGVDHLLKVRMRRHRQGKKGDVHNLLPVAVTDSRVANEEHERNLLLKELLNLVLLLLGSALGGAPALPGPLELLGNLYHHPIEITCFILGGLGIDLSERCVGPVHVLFDIFLRGGPHSLQGTESLPDLLNQRFVLGGWDIQELLLLFDVLGIFLSLVQGFLDRGDLPEHLVHLRLLKGSVLGELLDLLPERFDVTSQMLLLALNDLLEILLALHLEVV
mmetsp:Transcript_1669/g.3062  ORF Transcript_1669/g.3062 Transcript_1669/m.3062 type:complete len:223 (+) Transcript_1669:9668-10336(+)